MAQPEQPRSILQVTGADRIGFLQNLVTNDVCAPGLHYTALLTPQGKYLADFFVLQRPDDLLIDVASEICSMYAHVVFVAHSCGWQLENSCGNT